MIALLIVCAIVDVYYTRLLDKDGHLVLLLERARWRKYRLSARALAAVVVLLMWSSR